jgi:hypothetical protein
MDVMNAATITLQNIETNSPAAIPSQDGEPGRYIEPPPSSTNPTEPAEQPKDGAVDDEEYTTGKCERQDCEKSSWRGHEESDGGSEHRGGKHARRQIGVRASRPENLYKNAPV